MAIDARISAEKFASLFRAFANSCAFCGNGLNAPFEFSTNSGTHIVTSAEDYRADLCHIRAESHGGTWNLSNLFLAHSLCNRMQQNVGLAVYCDLINSHLTYNQIIESNRLAVNFDAAMANRQWNENTIQTAKIAASLESRYPKMFSEKRMSNHRLQTIRIGSAMVG